VKQVPWWILVPLAACQGGAFEEYEICSIDVLSVTPLSAAPGDEVAIVGTPLSEVRDTRIEVAGVRATVTSVVREDCESCDACRADAGCAPCGTCAGIGLEATVRDACFGDPLADPPTEGSCAACTENLAFVVPEVPAGPATVLILNNNGQGQVAGFEVLPSTSDTADTAASAR
jgi:hypothetical protein